MYFLSDGDETIGPLKGLFAGGLTATVKVSVLYPGEYAQILVQFNRATGKNQQSTRRSGVLDVIRLTVRQNGLTGLYRGLRIRLAGAIPGIAVRFGTHEKLKNNFGDERGQLPSAPMRLFCGFCAGAVEAILVTTPVKGIEIRAIAESANCPAGKYCGGGLASNIRRTVRQKGIRSIYRTLVPTIFRQGTAQSVRFGVNGTLKQWYQDGDPNRPISKLMIGAFGGAAGIISIYASTPFDCIRNRLQSDSHNSNSKSSSYHSTWDTTMSIVHKEGFKHLYGDAKLPRLALACADAAITSVVYETFMELFH